MSRMAGPREPCSSGPVTSTRHTPLTHSRPYLTNKSGASLKKPHPHRRGYVMWEASEALCAAIATGDRFPL